MNAFRVVVAPSGYKECLLAEEVAAAIARGVRRALDTIDVIEVPLVDGGEGFVRTLVRLTGGSTHKAKVRGPVGQPVTATWGMLGGADAPTAVIEMASAAGLALVPQDCRNPSHTTTFGVGQLIATALDAGAQRILLGCGDSGTNDAGAGMAQALGVRLLDRAGRDIRVGGIGLLDLDRIDCSTLDPRIGKVPIEVACNSSNLLCGPSGVARVYGPQKGASDRTIALLEEGLERFATTIRAEYGIDTREMPGGGASGGLGAGLHAFLGARLFPRFEIVCRYVNLDTHLRHADLVITAEGGIDRQSVCGKVLSEVGVRARRLGVPVIALAGSVGENAEVVHDYGIGACFSTVSAPCPLSKAMAQAPRQIERCAENVMRTVLLSMQIVTTHAQARCISAAV